MASASHAPTVQLTGLGILNSWNVCAGRSLQPGSIRVSERFRFAALPATIFRLGLSDGLSVSVWHKRASPQ